MTTTSTKPSADAASYPRSVPFIIGNEASERFSFYGMRSILTVFLAEQLFSALPTEEQRKAEAKAVFHAFVMGVYFFPLLGGWISDRLLGKYRTIFWLSIVYCVGQACLAASTTSKWGFYTGLTLIALGSGGIKPCVSAFVGDQFTAANKHLAAKIFAAFYWSINLGSFFASLSIPKIREHYGAPAAFAVPGVLMAISTIVFWAGRSTYVEIPPKPKDPHSFWRVVMSAFRGRKGGAHWLDAARAEHPSDAVEGAKAVLRVLLVFLPTPFFWMLFDQKASTWVLQAKRMDLVVGPWKFDPSQLQFINPALVMVLIPLCATVLYPAAARLGYELKPLRRMTIGMLLAAASFAMVAAIERELDAGVKLSVLWQVAPYVSLTLGEVLLSTTGLEFAYSQAPPAMKSTIMSFWNLAVSAGNLAVMIVEGLNLYGQGQVVEKLLLYGGITAVAGLALGVIARSYKTVDYYRTA
ncbi:MAG: POT family MFS transporter [Planctomycetes bacterium]|nr:POT family MFS transporter [Planctomycetota bacterium]